jgi:hypothetical protein
MKLIETIRKKWRQHDQKLAEHAHPDPQISPSGSPLLADGWGEKFVNDGIRAESAREHDEPQ